MIKSSPIETLFITILSCSRAVNWRRFSFETHVFPGKYASIPSFSMCGPAVLGEVAVGAVGEEEL
jgi:hypothetical protein